MIRFDAAPPPPPNRDVYMENAFAAPSHPVVVAIVRRAQVCMEEATNQPPIPPVGTGIAVWVWSERDCTALPQSAGVPK